ncbi:hypothetical protein [Alkalimonas mucilaginosa]|uniref:NfeD-like C-terminal domain-containing protein n=1 Tax=Alkalimonas mucilaginosa TaxID=3057676 RepID=A0ABU7JGB0_9GAMM|nr:hypothetical protein [Alkalimonas sp. MEB004]MEE2024175.1 hypothetical protein [Alkalimonas sp. MEB004]
MAAGVFVFLYGFILYGMYELSFQVVSWKKRLKEKYRGKEHFGWIMVPTLIAGVGVGVPLVFISIISFAVLVVLNSYTVGANRAADEIKAFVQCDHPEARCTRIFSGTDLIAEGKIVTVSAKSLAVFDGHRVLILDHDNLRVETEIQKQHR